MRLLELGVMEDRLPVRTLTRRSIIFEGRSKVVNTATSSVLLGSL